MNHPDWAALDSLAYETLEEAGLQAHVSQCSRCSAILEQLRSEQAFVRGALQEDVRDAVGLPAGFAAQAARRSPHVGLLPLLTLAATLLVAVAVVFLRPSAPSPTPAGDPRWLLPIEAAGESGLDLSSPYAVFRTRSGTMGTLGFTRHEDAPWFSTGLWISSGAGKPWLKRSFAGGMLSEPLLEGDSLSFLFVTAGSANFITLDPTNGRETSRVAIDGGHAYSPQVPLLLASGTERYGVVLYGDGRALFTRSVDGGKSWSRLREPGAPGFQCGSAALLATSGGLHLIRAHFPNVIHEVSTDAGESWTAGEVPGIPREFGASARDLAAALGRDVHLVCHTNLGHVLVFASRDEGRTWSEGRKLGTSAWSTFMIKRAADVLLIAFSDSQAPGGARFFVSRDAGSSWREDDAVTAGVRGGSGSPAVWIGSSGDFLAGFRAEPGGDLSGRKFILLREYRSAADPPPVRLSEERAAGLEATIGRLSHADPATREEAGRALLREGTAALPLLEAALRGPQDTEGRERIGLLIRRIRTGLPDPLPVWWAPGK